MKYISTRGEAPVLEFSDVLLQGLARDGGLYLPETWPQFDADTIASFAGKPYQDVAFEVISPFVAGAIPEDDLKSMIAEAYDGFRHPAVTPLVQTGPNTFILELFHGPTLAFKDVAMQLLGRMMDYVLTERGLRATIVGATSGDTGGAAIEAFRGRERTDIFILFPDGRVSSVQRRQMTTPAEKNVHALALNGDFDDCQAIVKGMFNHFSFRDRVALSGVNSINWARIMAQIVYYFYAGLALGAPGRPVAFSVPTGNFGDIFAGYLARQMGLPVAQLIIATNRNDVLHRVMTTGSYGRQTLEHSLSPSMDITVSSNFERLLFDLYDRDGGAVAELMRDFDRGDIHFSEQAMQRARALFSSHRVSDEETCAQIAATWRDCEYLLDPHSAIGVKAALASGLDSRVPVVTLATAHPAKFPQAIQRAEIGVEPPLPLHLVDLFDRSERFEVLPNDLAAVQSFMANNLGA